MFVFEFVVLLPGKYQSLFFDNLKVGVPLKDNIETALFAMALFDHDEYLKIDEKIRKIMRNEATFCD